MAFRYRMERYKKKHRLHTLDRWLISFFSAAVLAAFVFLVWLVPLKIPNDAMDPTFEEGAVVYADRLYKYLKRPARWDVIVYRDAEKRMHIRRIVAVAGDEVSGVNGSLRYKREFRLEEDYASGELKDFKEFTVPEGTVLALPDNRSYCGTVSLKDCIPLSKIRGVVKIKIHPEIVFYD